MYLSQSFLFPDFPGGKRCVILRWAELRPWDKLSIAMEPQDQLADLSCIFLRAFCVLGGCDIRGVARHSGRGFLKSECGAIAPQIFATTPLIYGYAPWNMPTDMIGLEAFSDELLSSWAVLISRGFGGLSVGWALSSLGGWDCGRSLGDWDCGTWLG